MLPSITCKLDTIIIIWKCNIFYIISYQYATEHYLKYHLTYNDNKATLILMILISAQAFELRYKQMLKRKKQPVVVPDR